MSARARQQANDLLALLRRERDTLAEFLLALAAFDRDRGWEALGHNSLFAFLVKDLGLSNGAAAYRKAAVELVQRIPQVIEPIRDGRLCITTVFELSKVITDENASEVLPRFFGSSKRDAKNVVAELAPEPAPTRTVVTAVSAALALAALPDPAGRLADRVRANPAPTTPPGRDAQWSRATLVRSGAATSPPTSGARSGSGTEAGAPGPSRAAASAARRTSSSSITWTGSRAARPRPSRAAGSSAVLTSSSRRGSFTGTTSW